MGEDHDLDFVHFWTKIRERNKLQRNEFSKEGVVSPFRENSLAEGSFSPKMSSKMYKVEMM